MDKTLYQTSDFDYVFPQSLIAHEPLAERSAAKLLVSRPGEALRHDQFFNLVEHLPVGTLLVANQSRVIKAKVKSEKPSFEFLFIEPRSANRWLVIGKPRKKILKAETIQFPGGVLAKAYDIGGPMCFELEISDLPDGSNVWDWLEAFGAPPLPPYIRTLAEDSVTAKQYQTVYADKIVDGLASVAAPTAGLHFDQRVFESLKQKEIDWVGIELYVGLGTFLPVQTECIAEHQMHQERFRIPRIAYEKIMAAKKEGRPVVYVGTTTLRALESFYLQTKNHDPAYLLEKTLTTELFLYPQGAELYQPAWMDALITNFHQPRSTLLMLVSALYGQQRIMEIYQEAIRQRYRFFSFGDASLLWLE